MSFSSGRIGDNFGNFLGYLNADFETDDGIGCTDAKIHFVMMSERGPQYIFDKVIKFEEKKTLVGVYDRVSVELNNCRDSIKRVNAIMYQFALDLFLKDGDNKILWFRKQGDYPQGADDVPSNFSNTSPMQISDFQGYYAEAQKKHNRIIIQVLDPQGNFVQEASFTTRLGLNLRLPKPCLLL